MRSSNTRFRKTPIAVAAVALFSAAPLAAQAAATPYNGSPIALPKTFAAVEFDKGGQNVAYRDLSSGNTGGAFRASEDVDIIASENEAGPYAINHFQTGEWVSYTVSVPTSGTYDIAILASQNYARPTAFHIEVDGKDVTGKLGVPKTGGWGTFEWVGKEKVQLSAGTHVIKVVSDNEYFNFAAVRVVANGTTTPSYGGTPYSGSPIVVPKEFAAVDFDKGGQGVAYHDLSQGNSGGLHRTSEDVDIIAWDDPISSFAINGFQTGEWVAYTIDVPASGQYDLGVKASTNYSRPSGFHIEIDGADVTGSVSVPNTGGWSNFQWVDKKGVQLSKGKHVLKVVADSEYFNFGAVRVVASGGTSTPPADQYAGTPFNGSPVALPKAFPAADFDRGGQGVAYRDMSPGNEGGQYRTSEDVDIVNGGDDPVSPYAVNSFQKGEWLNYTVNVPKTGKYDISVRAANNYASPTAFRILVDGKDMTGPVSVPRTGSWSSYQWVGKQGVQLEAGKRVLRLVADAEYFNVAGVSVLETGSGGTTDPLPSDGGNPDFSCSFENSPTDCGFTEQAKQQGRASLVSIARDGVRGVRLHTEPGDNNVNGSGSWERNDLRISQSLTDCYEGREAWWGHSVLFPSDYVVPNSGGVVMDFHHTGSGGQANFHVDAMRDGLRLRGFGGPVINEGRYEVWLGPVQRNVWYDFVYHVKWSSKSDGFMYAWVNGKLKLAHQGPTLYEGLGCYLKLANYHDAFGEPSSVIHDRVRRGKSWVDVSRTPLEGLD